MRLRQFRRVIPEEVGADVGFTGIIVGHGGMQLRGSDSAVNAAIRVRRLVQLQCQDGTDELIRFALGAEEISQGIEATKVWRPSTEVFHSASCTT